MKYIVTHVVLILITLCKLQSQGLAYPNKIVKADGYVISSSNGDTKLIASELITLKPGVQIKLGSTFLAQIKENFVLYPAVYPGLIFPSYTQLISDELIINRKLNPTLSIHTILIYDKDNKYQRQIKPTKTQDIISIDFAAQVAGLYHLIFIYSDGTKKELKVLKY